MEVVIGIQFATRELRLELDEEAQDIRKTIEEAFASDRKLVWLTDNKGRQVAVPLDKVAYVEVDASKAGKQVGFSARVES